MNIVAELNKVADRIVLTDEYGSSTPFNDSPLVKRIPGALWDSGAKRWTLPASWPACVQARAVFGSRLKVGTRLGAWARTERERRDAVMNVRNAQALVDDDGEDTAILRSIREEL